MQKAYWSSMVQWKYELMCIESIFRKNITVARMVKIFTAFISSAAVASWAVWNKYSLLWGGIVVVSQLFSVIYEYTPYQTRISRLSQVTIGLNDLYQDIEDEWFHISNGELSETEIVDARSEFAKRWNSKQDKAFDSDWVSVSGRKARKISEETDQYFANLYGES